MLGVTESAAEALQLILDNLDTQPGQCVRLRAVSHGNLGFKLDAERQGDQVVKHGDKKILVLDSETAKKLKGVVLKYWAREEAEGFTLLRKARAGQKKRKTQRLSGA